MFIKIKRFEYTGDVQTLELKPGRYRFECYGAGGGNDSGTLGGRGGYTSGVYTTKKTITINVVIGGGGKTNANSTGGGYNGGGNAGTSGHAGGGGGATHIALTNRGVLANYNHNRYEIIMVAGGGGGSGYYDTKEYPHHGGGLEGGRGGALNYPTQTYGYAFGQGENRQGDGGGGGGGWYGGYAGNGDVNGSGGSGYYNTNMLTSYETIMGNGADSTKDGYVIIYYDYDRVNSDMYKNVNTNYIDLDILEPFRDN